MMYGDREGKSTAASPGLIAICPLCSEALIAKCGRVKIWHWAHKSLVDCDAWAEGETAWHRGWKEKFPVGAREFIVGDHRADVLIHKTVLEFQSKALTTEEMLERERHYRSRGFGYVWVFDGTALGERFKACREDGNDHASFRWKHGWQRLLDIPKPFHLDLGDGRMAEIKSFRMDEGRCFGYYKKETVEDFIRRFI